MEEQVRNIQEENAFFEKQRESETVWNALEKNDDEQKLLAIEDVDEENVQETEEEGDVNK